MPKATSRALLEVVGALVKLGELREVDSSGGVPAVVVRVQGVHHARVKHLEQYLALWTAATAPPKDDPRSQRRPLAVAVAQATQHAAGQSSPEDASPWLELASLLQAGVAGERFNAASLGAFLELMRPALAAADAAGSGARAWLAGAKALLAHSPLEHGAAQRLATSGEALLTDLRDLQSQFPDRILYVAASSKDHPRAGRAADEGDHGTFTAPGAECESGRVRLALEAACAGTQQGAADSALAIQAWCQTLLERAGLASGPFVVFGLPADDEALKSAAGVERLGRLAREDSNDALAGNRGLYRKQAPLLLGQRIVADALEQVARARPQDALALRQRAAALGVPAGVGVQQAAWTLGDVLADPARSALALGIETPGLHQPNREPRYGVRAELYGPEHELTVWHALRLLDTLARGLPGENDLRWSFSLSDSKGGAEGDREVIKTVHAWDGRRPLVGQRLGAGPRFWRGFWGDPPVGPTRRVVFDAALQAVLELLAEQRSARAMKHAERRAAGLALRPWVPATGLPVAEILGLRLDASAADTLDAAAGDAAPLVALTADSATAALVGAQGRRLVEALEQRLGRLLAAPPPHFKSLLPALEGCQIAFDAEHASVCLVDRTH
ncbi:MAG: hypothetical protein IPL40_12920 [Proteobacteria bacterium]|nr:hypothetical protein [Pseudomonadota bacterium]